MKIVNSISRPQKVYETSGSQPALILCDDFNLYVCKYNRQQGVEAKKLFNEFLAGHFAQIWNLSIPEFCLVKVNPEHISGHNSLQPAFFKTTCFGSKHNRHLAEVDEFYSEISPAQKKKFHKKYDFLKIALFDIWLANEDRNYNNYNLLIDIENQNKFTPIDHDAIFNTGNLDKGLVLLCDNESLIHTDLVKRLFTSKELRNSDFMKNLKKEYYLYISKCENNLDRILQKTPDDWQINRAEYQNLLKENLFKKQWVDESLEYFLYLVQLQFK